MSADDGRRGSAKKPHHLEELTQRTRGNDGALSSAPGLDGGRSQLAGYIQQLAKARRDEHGVPDKSLGGAHPQGMPSTAALRAAIRAEMSEGIISGVLGERPLRPQHQFQHMVGVLSETMRVPRSGRNRYTLGEMTIAFARRPRSSRGHFVLGFNSKGQLILPTEEPPEIGSVATPTVQELFRLIPPEAFDVRESTRLPEWTPFYTTHLGWMLVDDATRWQYHDDPGVAPSPYARDLAVGVPQVSGLSFSRWRGDPQMLTHPSDPTVVVYVSMGVTTRFSSLIASPDIVIAMISTNGGQTFPVGAAVNANYWYGSSPRTIDFPRSAISRNGTIALTWKAEAPGPVGSGTVDLGIYIRIGRIVGTEILWLQAFRSSETRIPFDPSLVYSLQEIAVGETSTGTIDSVFVVAVRAANDDEFYTGPFDIILRRGLVAADGSITWTDDLVVETIPSNIPLTPAGDPWRLGINARPTVAIRPSVGISGHVLVAYYVNTPPSDGGTQVKIREVDIATWSVIPGGDVFTGGYRGEIQFFPTLLHNDRTDCTALAYLSMIDSVNRLVGVFVRAARSGRWQAPGPDSVTEPFSPLDVTAFVDRPELTAAIGGSNVTNVALPGGHSASIGDYIGLCIVPSGEAGVPIDASGFAVSWADQFLTGAYSRQAGIQVFWV